MRFVWLTASLVMLSAGCDGSQPPSPQRKDLRLPDLPRYRIDGIGPGDGFPLQDRAADLRRDRGADLRRDGYLPPPAKCGGSSPLRIQEVATGQPDYFALVNKGTSTVDLKGYRVELTGIGLVLYAFAAGSSVGSGKTIYVFEYATGQAGDIATGDNIPFYDSSGANAVALWDPAGYLVDYVAIGDAVIGLPYGASAGAIPWPASFDPKTQSFQRVASSGSCPVFKTSDWAVKPITRK